MDFIHFIHFGEIVFDIFYLFTIIGIGLKMHFTSRKKE